MNEIVTGNVYDNFSENEEIFDFSNYSAKSKYYDDSKALKNEMGGAAIE